MKIFNKNNIAIIDRQTIQEEPITEIELMERASVSLADWIIERYGTETIIAIFAGPGNNGGDAFVLARFLSLTGYKITVFLSWFDKEPSACCLMSRQKTEDISAVKILSLKEGDLMPDLSDFHLIVDGLFGYGLTRPLSGIYAALVNHINSFKLPVISIDLPSGLLCDVDQDVSECSIIKAETTLTFELPKIPFFFRENETFVGKWHLLSIGLSKKAIAEQTTLWNFLDQEKATSIFHRRNKFAHKGDFGHALLLAGSRGKMGAALLAARGALRAGAGLLTVHLPESGNALLQTYLPEAMVSTDCNAQIISEIPDLKPYNAVAMGPGIGQSEKSCRALQVLLNHRLQSMILDADAINILSSNPDWIKNLPSETILTPHPGEFSRLVGFKTTNDRERWKLAGDFSRSKGLILILKGAYTQIFFPDGEMWFNSTGNPGMATAGSGDVLTGILLGLLSQSYSARDAALLGVFLHGRSADLWVKNGSEEALLSSDIADNIGAAFQSLK